MLTSFSRTCSVVSNTYAANVGGIAASELHAVELEFLSRIDYRLNLQPWELEQGLQDIRHHAAGVNNREATSCFYCNQMKHIRLDWPRQIHIVT